MSKPWTLDEGLRFARRVEKALKRAGWHAALTGGVLYRGRSDKDIDIVVYPHKKHGARLPRATMREALERCGMTQRCSRAWMQRSWARRGIHDEKWVEVWNAPDGRRVDVLVLS